MKKMKKGLALILALALLTLTFAGCGGSSDPSDNVALGDALDSTVSAGSDDTVTAEVDMDDDKIQQLIDSHTDENGKTFVTVTITDDPGTMLPQGPGSSKPRMVVLEGIFECLFTIQGTGGPIEGTLATHYDEMDEMTYRIYLKDYIYDSDGNHFTANDVRFVIMEVGKEEYKVAALNYVDEVNVIDDYTVDIVFNTKMQNYRINVLVTYFYTEAAYKASPDGMITTPVGTGPYKLTNYVTGSEMVFETYEGYWESDESKIIRNSFANVDKIIYKIVQDSAQRVIALEAGEVDMSTGVMATDLNYFLNNDDFNVFNSVQDQVVSLFFNCSSESPLQDLRVRQAVAYAIDAQGVIDAVDQGYGEMCYTTFCDLFPDYNPEWENEDYYLFNADYAKELLAEAGYSDGELNLVIMFESNDRLASVAQVIQGYLLNIGINLEIFPCDGALFNTYKLDGTKFDINMASTGSSTWGSSSLIGNLATHSPDTSLIAIQEDELWEKITIMSENAYSDWSYAHDLHYYVKDNCYAYMLYAPINFTVTTNVVTGLVLNQKGMDSPNCCTYIWN